MGALLVVQNPVIIPLEPESVGGIGIPGRRISRSTASCLYYLFYYCLLPGLLDEVGSPGFILTRQSP